MNGGGERKRGGASVDSNCPKGETGLIKWKLKDNETSKTITIEGKGEKSQKGRVPIRGRKGQIIFSPGGI